MAGVEIKEADAGDEDETAGFDGGEDADEVDGAEDAAGGDRDAGTEQQQRRGDVVEPGQVLEVAAEPERDRAGGDGGSRA